MSETDSNIWYCQTNEDGTLEVVLGFQREQLLYDVKNYSYIEGHILASENVHQVHTIKDVGEEGNVDRVTRVFDLAVSQCREMLYPYTKNELSNFALNDKLKERSSYGIVLALPSDFSQTTVTLLERLIHEYIVCKAMADWMSIVNPPKEETWMRKYLDLESEIRESVHRRQNRVRRKLSVLP